MKYVHPQNVINVIRRLYKDAANIRIMQAFRPRRHNSTRTEPMPCETQYGVGWEKLDGDNGYPLREIGRLYDHKYTAVQFRFQNDGLIVFPDYQMDELVTEFRWEPRDQLTVNVNQGDREAVVLAVIGDEALIEYEMPAGSTAMWVIHACYPHPGKIRSISYKSCPKKWLAAIEESGQEWIGNGQS